MSYNTQNNTQQKSVGFFIVFAFHALLIIGLIKGLDVHIGSITHQDPITFKNIQEKTTPIVPVQPTDPVFNNTQTIITTTIPLESFTITPETDTSGISGTTGDTLTATTSEITKPTLVRATKPEYPSAAIRLSEEGATTMVLFLNEAGKVVNAQVANSSGSTRLDDAAIKHAMHNWAFSPCTEDSKPVACTYKTKLVWKIADVKR